MAKVRVDLNSARTDIKLFKKAALKGAQEVLAKEIPDSIKRGVSPVKGFGRFPEYSEVYKEAIRNKRYRTKTRIRPVNLTLTGELLKSFSVKIKRSKLIIAFDNKLADIHNRLGAGKSRTVRRLLPTQKDERFTRRIITRIAKVMNTIAKSRFK